MKSDHCFVVPAYGKSPHLGECLRSLRAQLVASRIIITTSTPFDGIERIAADAGASLIVHAPNRGIGHDWNKALDAADAAWVTLAHQDDTYLPEYSRRVMQLAARYPDASLIFTDYRELSGEHERPVSNLLRIKKLLLEFAFLGRTRIRSRGAKMRAVRFGCPIPCPTATLGPAASGYRFDESLRINLDWNAWIHLAEQDGSFCYIREVLQRHRIHDESETSAGLRDGARAIEDRAMFVKLWPMPIARLLSRLYSRSYSYGSLD